MARVDVKFTVMRRNNAGFCLYECGGWSDMARLCWAGVDYCLD